MNHSLPGLTHENILAMISAIRDLHQQTSHIYNQYNNQPAHSSLAHQEQLAFPDEELVRDVYSRGILSMEMAAEHLLAFTDCLDEPSNPLAAWTCVRSLLESCALAVWFLDPSIDVKERVGRCFAFRYHGFTEQMKLSQVVKNEAERDKAEQRLKDVERKALALGYPRIANKHGKIDGIGQRWPSIVGVIQISLDAEFNYRLLSSVSHGHHWAIHQLGFQLVGDTPDGMRQAIKYVHPAVAVYAGTIAVSAFMKVLWYLWRVYGWNRKELEDLLETIADRLNYASALRFWRP